MARIGTGAPHGLRLSLCGIAVAAFTLANSPSRAAPYSDIIVDANSGTVLHETNPDARRHPASLTKIMTLYLLFEQLEAGKLKLDSQMQVSKEAAGQMPTKLGLKPGSTIAVEDAIKGIGEAIAGDEDTFAQLMTRKAQALGMSRTLYKNASGLPDPEQVTTARDQSILGRAIQERFPRYYKYFSIRSFTFRGQSIGNHNHLLGRVEGVDGIKTGYISASGFNLVTSVHRGNRYLIGVVMGGSSAGSRDARMRELISEKIAQASTKRTASMIAEAGRPAESKESKENKAEKVAEKATAQSDSKGETKRTARAERKGEPRGETKPQKAETNAEPQSDEKPEPRFAVASVGSVPARIDRRDVQPEATPTVDNSAAPAVTAIVGSTEPFRPILVRTLSVRAGTQTPAVAPLQASSPPANAAIEATPERISAAPVATEAQPARIAEPAPALLQARGTGRDTMAATAPARTAEENEPFAGSSPKAHARGGWVIQVGAYHAEEEAKERLASVQSKASKMLTGADAFTETFDKGGTTFYRARFVGLDKDKAEAACKYLKKNDVECVTIKN
jgi:D-alanyl-D-alanine carboxypeptidase